MGDGGGRALALGTADKSEAHGGEVMAATSCEKST